MKKRIKWFFISLFIITIYPSILMNGGEDIRSLIPKKIAKYYRNYKDNGSASVSLGSVSNGSLKNAKLLPYLGTNYRYFDRWSYLQGRAFLNGQVMSAVLASYQEMEKSGQGRIFTIMECSRENGGKLWPHRTHQNGLSIDFMMPMDRERIPCYELDLKGLKHYLLDFDDEGKYEKDKSIQINFEVLARHLLSLEANARARGYRVKKVIIKIEFKDELFATPSGQKLREKGIYVVKTLSPKINKLHDDHYHVDFVKM